MNSKKSCSANKIRNPTTGRCVSRNGKVGRNFLEQNENINNKSYSGKTDLNIVLKTHPKYSNIKKGSEFILSNIKGYKIIEKVGEGSYGVAYLLHKLDDSKDEKILKIAYLPYIEAIESFEKEIIMQEKAVSYGLAPKIYNRDSTIYNYAHEGIGVIVMDKISDTMMNIIDYDIGEAKLKLLFEGIVYLIDELCLHGIIHGDFHPGNIDRKSVV